MSSHRGGGGGSNDGRILRAMVCVLLTFTMASVAAAQGISGSAHDFSTGSTGWAGSSGEICVYCHTPHNALSTNGPLWNHTQSNVASYNLYANPNNTMNSTLVQPSGASKLCLSCHDGTVALDSYGGNIPPANTQNLWTYDQNKAIGGAGGNDLSDDHPISIDYTNTHVDIGQGGLYDPSTTTGNGNQTALGGTIAADLLLNSKVECSSCHDVHNKYGGTYLLKISNTASGLCLTCHWK